MRRIHRSPRFLRAMLIAFACVILMMIIIGGEFFTSARQRASHLLFTANRQSEQIVIIAIDDATLQALGRAPTEWTRDEYIPVVEALSENSARVIAIDLLFPEPAPGDVALASAIERARSGERRTRFVLSASAGGRLRPASLPNGSRAARFQTRLLPVDFLARQVDYIGYGNAVVDDSGTQCCQLSYVTVQEHISLSFSLATYLAYLRVPPDVRDNVVYSNGDRLYVTPERSFTVDEYGQWIQNYNASTGQGFPILSFLDVAEGRADLSIIEDRIVLIGLYNAAGAVDTYPVPGSERAREMSGVEIQANAIDTLLQDSALREVTRTELLLMIAALAVISALIYEHLRWYLRPIAVFVLVALLVAFAQYVLMFQKTIIPIFDGGLTLALPLVASLGIYTWREGRQRQLAEYAVGIAEREKRLLGDIILGVPAPTAIVSRDLDILTLNHAFTQLIDSDMATGYKRRLLDLLRQEGLHNEYIDELRSRLTKEQDFHIDLSFKQHTYTCSANWLPRLNRWVMAWADITMLTEMNEVKRHMLLMVSHDLRNPLSALNLQLYQLKRLLTAPDPAVKKTIESAEFSTKTIQHILTDVIDLEQVRTLTFPTTLVPLDQVCQTIRDRYQEDAQRKQQTLTLVVPAAGMCIQANEGQITQMLANLVSNAIKYTPERGVIAVTLKLATANRARIEVSDTGIGIPKDAQGKLFTEFYRVKSRATSEIPGTGLGLSLVKTIVRKHGGQIWFESQEGIGTTFYVEFPITTTEQKAP